jgi:hypothetical protein
MMRYGYRITKNTFIMTNSVAKAMFRIPLIKEKLYIIIPHHRYVQ